MVPGEGHWIISYLVPPLLGAGIGYLTNAVAIRMLFRPFTEKRVFGIRIPFTPGVIPKHRYELAENIGVLVANELLSKDMLQEHFLSPKFTQELIAKAGSIADTISKKKIGDLLPLVRKNKRTNWNCKGLIRSKKIMSNSLSALLPLDAEVLVMNLFKILYPTILDTMLIYLSDPDVRTRLLDEGRKFIEDVQKKMNIFQKFMISAGRYDKTLKDRMPEIVDDIIGKIEAVGRDERNIKVLEDSLRAGIDMFIDVPLSEIEGLQGFTWDNLIQIPEGKIGQVLFTLRHVRIEEIVRLDEKQKGQFDNWVLRSGMELIVKKMDAILHIIDIKTLVVDRINKLSIQDVERLLLIIIEKHLTWINVFGAIIGSFIGGAQILLRLIQ